MKALRDQDIELIERVLSQSASDEDIATFHARSANEPEFAARVKILENIKANVKAESDQFEQLLESIHQEHGEDKTMAKTKKQPGLEKYYYIAASLVLLIAAIFVFKGLNGRSSIDKLYANNFTVPPENITTRDNTGLDDDLIAALNSYRQKDFKKAILNFGAYLKIHPDDDAANFYMGVSYLADNQYAFSIDFLQKVISNRDSIYGSAAQWYLGLAYLKSADLAKAKAVFSELSKSNSSYAAKSQVILETLGKE